MSVGDHSERIAVRVMGRVQGVGFRYFARSEARRRDLVGWVRNDRDGSVSIVAEGARAGLESFVAALRSGPAGARVADVAVSWERPKGEFADFGVRYS